MKHLQLVFLALTFSISPTSTQAATCPVETCAKFDLPGDFPGKFYIDFTATSFFYSFLNGFVAGFGSLSTESTITFTVADQQQENPDRYNLSVDPGDFKFLDLRASQGSTNPVSIWGAGTGVGWIDTATGDWELNMPTLIAPESQSNIEVYFVRDLLFSTLNPGGAAMNLNPNDTDWGQLTIANNGTLASENFDEALLNKIISENNLASAIDPFDAESYPLVFDFVIEGVDPISAVPVPAAAWLFGSALIGLVGVKRKK